jgi:hypothetical protein
LRIRKARRPDGVGDPLGDRLTSFSGERGKPTDVDSAKAKLEALLSKKT